MPNNPSHRRPESIALPEVLKDALTQADKNVPLASYSARVRDIKSLPENEESLRLASENHAFYVGKIIPPTTGEKIRGLLGWGEVRERIYSKESIAAMLDFAIAHKGEGEKIRFVITPKVSELFNGFEDVECSLSIKEEIEFIRKIARRKFGLKEVDLEVTDITENPLHSHLFEQLNASVSENTGKINPEVAFRKNSISYFSDNPDSLEIARCLYNALKNNKESNLSEIFHGTMPKEIREKVKEDENPPEAYYGLAEVAMRLAEIAFSENIIHGGTGRQKKYDYIIEGLIKGKGGRFRDIKELEDLFKILEGKSFATIHIKDDENYYSIKKRSNLVRARLALTTTLALGAGAGLYQMGKMSSEREKEKWSAIENKEIFKEIENLTFYMNGPFLPLPKESNLKIFNDILNQILGDIQDRYEEIDEELLKELTPFLKRYLLDNKNALYLIHGGNYFKRFDIADMFVQKYRFYFMENGIDTKDPYNRLRKYQKDFESFLESSEDYSFTTEIAPMSYRKFPNRYEVSPIGTFNSGEVLNPHYEFFWYTPENGKKSIVAIDPQKSSPGETAYSSKRARNGIWQFLYMQKRYGATSLHPYEKELNESRMRYGTDYPNMPCRELELEKDELSTRKIEQYTDQWGGIYEFGIAYDHDRESNTTTRCLVAKKEGGKKYSGKTGEELAHGWEDLYGAWYDYYHGNPTEAALPINFDDIRKKMAMMLSFANQAEIENPNIEEIEYIRNVVNVVKEEIAEYDDSYDKTSNLINSLEHLEELQDKILEQLNGRGTCE